MKIIEKKIEQIAAYKNNPRNNANAVQAVAESIKQYGFLVPIVIDRQGTVIAGDTRLKAAKLLKLEKIPCVLADNLSEEQINAFRLADNKTAEISTWDTDALRAEFQALKDTGFDLALTGFNIDEIDHLLQEAQNTELLDSSKEINVGEYEDEAFECTCPRCGFRFNR